MSDQDANLRDVTTGVTEPVIPETTDAKETTVQVAADTSAAELGQILLDSGFSKDNINDLISTPNALQSIQHMIRNNPAEFLNMLDRTDPAAAKGFHEKMAELYVDRYSSKETPGSNTPAAPPELMNEIAVLREKTARLETDQQQRDANAALARLESQYSSRVEQMFNDIKQQGIELTKSEKRALTADLNSQLALDGAAKKRISNGNFVDVPKKFNDIIRDWSADKKAVSEAVKGRRENASRNAFPELQNGPITVDIPKGFEDSWDSTEDAFAKALESTSR